MASLLAEGVNRHAHPGSPDQTLREEQDILQPPRRGAASEKAIGCKWNGRKIDITATRRGG
jgi:hypothetical protein